MKKRALFLILAVALMLACSGPALFSTPTPAPTNTPLPTSTPLPTNTPLPTSTPIPLTVGVDTPLKIDGMQLTVDQVILTDKYTFDYLDENGVTQWVDLTANDPSDQILAIIFKATGQIQNTADWHDITDSTYVHILDESNRRDDLWISLWNKDNDTIQLIFVAYGSSSEYTLYFPDGQTIDLTPFLD